MIAFIQGVITEIGDDYIVINHQGLGWLVYYPHSLEVHVGEELQVFTHMSVSENDMRLYGFSSSKEKTLFLNSFVSIHCLSLIPILSIHFIKNLLFFLSQILNFNLSISSLYLNLF